MKIETAGTDPLVMARERAQALDNLRYEAHQTLTRFSIGQRVKYSSCGDAGISAGVYEAGEVIDITLDSDGAGVKAIVIFDGQNYPECLDARLLRS